MLHFRTATTCTIAESPEPVRRSNIRRVRLTLHNDGNSTSTGDEPEKRGKAETEDKLNTGNSQKCSGFLQTESDRTQSLKLHVSNGLGPEMTSHRRMYGVVKRADANKAEVVVYEWSVNQLKEEMNYIKEVRHSLEKVRQQMFGEFNGMKKQLQELSSEVKASEARQELLQKEVRSNSAALEQCSQTNNSLTALTIDMQRSFLDSTVVANKKREEMESLRKKYHKSLEQMKEKDQQIENAQAENQILKLKIESSQEANTSAMRDMTRKLYDQYEAKLKDAKKQHQAEMEAIQARINQAVQELEEANKKAAEAEQKIAERDQRIQELDQFVARMEKERHLLQQKLQEHERQLWQLQQKDELDSGNLRRSQKLEEEAASLRERIQHLDHMVHCQQRKVKQMIEEIEVLKSKIEQKDVTIEDLMERISFLEAENKELQDKLDYMMSLEQRKMVQSSEQAVSCDIPIRNTPIQGRQNVTTPYLRLMELSEQRQTR
ncbi:myocardial zonula adherens protein [Stegostoma tigrinum]|uniref:myocardial zonula adherens protein n=1 Tax=Stegostoma tigrinum TaxID=3053191 RepID=UPI00202B83FA|nr:myocardial zonula adherens protein [Stegostoma tigrinum]